MTIKINTPFPPHQITNKGTTGQQFLKAELIIKRLNEVFGTAYTVNTDIIKIEEKEDTTEYTVFTKTTIIYFENGEQYSRDGFAVYKNKEFDTAVKSSATKSLKKAADTLGIGLELNNEARQAFNKFCAYWDNADKATLNKMLQSALKYYDYKNRFPTWMSTKDKMREFLNEACSKEEFNKIQEKFNNTEDIQ